MIELNGQKLYTGEELELKKYYSDLEGKVKDKNEKRNNLKEWLKDNGYKRKHIKGETRSLYTKDKPKQIEYRNL